MFKFLALAGFLVAGFAPPALAYPGGAPIEACDTLAPEHGPGLGGQTTPPPYVMTLDRTSASAGQEVVLTVTGANETDLIRGFLAQVFMADDGERVGSWKIAASDDVAKPLDCGNMTASAATHKNRMDSASIALTWVAPSNTSGRANFTITLVKERTIYWVGALAGQVNLS